MSFFSAIANWIKGTEPEPQATEPEALGEIPYSVRYGSGGEKWLNGLSSSGRSRSINHFKTRQNARKALQESCQARAIVERFADTVVDTGLRLEMSPNIEVLGISRKEAESWARDIEARFDLWARDKKQHRSETMTFYQAERFYMFSQHRDNDVFVRFFYDDDPTLQNPLQFEFIDPDQIRGDALTTTYGIQNQSDGIVRDERGRETGYNVWVRKSDGTYDSVTIPASTKGRTLMIHGFRPEYAGQGRGYSRLAHAIQEFENITDFSAASIKKAINQSSIVGFVEPSKEEDANNPFEGIMTNSGAGPASTISDFDPTATTGTSDRMGITDSYQVPEATMNVPGSMFIANLTKGSTIKLAGNTAPADSYDTFVDAFAGNIAASMGIPLEVVLMKFSNNYSASRGTLLLFWRVANGWAAEMDADFLSTTVEMWLCGEIAAGRVVAPGWSDPRLRAAWLCKSWIGSPVPDIDPAKSAKARRENVEIGLSNLDREARDLNGTSAAANIEKNKALYGNFSLAPWSDKANQNAEPAKSGQKPSAIFDQLERIEQLLEDMQ